MIKIVPYEPTHGYQIFNKYARDIELKLSQSMDYRQWIQNRGNVGPAYTVTNGEVLLCGGVHLFGQGRGEAWTLLSTLFYHHKKSCYKAIRDTLNSIIYVHKLVRIQAVVKADNEPGMRMAEHLGFNLETPEGMRRYGPDGETYLLYARVT